MKGCFPPDDNPVQRPEPLPPRGVVAADIGRFLHEASLIHPDLRTILVA